MNESIIKLPEVKNRTGLSRSTIYLKIQDGEFPKPVRIGARAVGWIKSEIDTWVETTIKISRNG